MLPVLSYPGTAGLHILLQTLFEPEIYVQDGLDLALCLSTLVHFLPTLGYIQFWKVGLLSRDIGDVEWAKYYSNRITLNLSF